MADREPEKWITVNGVHIPVYAGQSKSDAIKEHIKRKTEEDEKAKAKQIEKNKEEAKKKESEEDNSYHFYHRPGNPLKYPDEVATIDKLLNGNYFPKDLLQHPRDYFPDYGDFKGTEQIISTLRKVQNNPDMEITIYRGAPSGGRLNQGDWVSLSKEYAEDYAKGGRHGSEGAKVYSYKVKAKDISFDGDSIYEFGYWGKSRK